MGSNVVNDQRGTYKYRSTIRNKKIDMAGRRIELTQFTVMDAARHHRLPRIIQQFLEL